MNEEANQEQNTTSEKVFTEAEVNELLQKETDKRVTSALTKQKNKYDEAQKLADMSLDEKSKYTLSKREEELAERESKILKQELLNEVSKQMTEKNLPSEAASFLVAQDAEQSAMNINKFQELFQKAVQLEVTKRVSVGTPNAATGADNGAITKEQFNKMNVRQQAQLYQTQPKVYEALTQ